MVIHFTAEFCSHQYIAFRTLKQITNSLQQDLINFATCLHAEFCWRDNASEMRVAPQTICNQQLQRLHFRSLYQFTYHALYLTHERPNLKSHYFHHGLGNVMSVLKILYQPSRCSSYSSQCNFGIISYLRPCTFLLTFYRLVSYLPIFSKSFQLHCRNWMPHILRDAFISPDI